MFRTFLKDETQRTKQFGMAIEIHGRITASGERVFLLKSTNIYVASSQHQSIRRLNSLNRFVVGHKFRSLFV